MLIFLIVLAVVTQPASKGRDREWLRFFHRTVCSLIRLHHLRTWCISNGHRSFSTRINCITLSYTYLWNVLAVVQQTLVIVSCMHPLCNCRPYNTVKSLKTFRLNNLVARILPAHHTCLIILLHGQEPPRKIADIRVSWPGEIIEND